MNANIEKYKALDGIRTYSAIGIVLMHVLKTLTIIVFQIIYL